jgi:hypothetical protein
MGNSGPKPMGFQMIFKLKQDRKFDFLERRENSEIAVLLYTFAERYEFELMVNTNSNSMTAVTLTGRLMPWRRVGLLCYKL